MTIKIITSFYCIYLKNIYLCINKAQGRLNRVKHIEVRKDELRSKAHQLSIYDLSDFYASDLLNRNNFTYDDTFIRCPIGYHIF